MNKNNCSLFRFYLVNEKEKGKLHYISFKFLFLSIYMIGFYCNFLNNIYEENIVHSKKYIEIISRKLYEFENNSNYKRITLENKPYNDLSKNLTEKELFDVLNSLEECPSKEDLRNIWTHTLGVAKEGLDDILNVLKGSIQKYLDNDIIGTKNHMGTSFIYDRIWKGNIFRFSRTVAAEEVEYTNKFLGLINEKHTFDDILKFIYSFLDHFNSLKKELYKKHQEELLQKITQTSRSLENK
ncbi:Plasmodium exported protein (PHISTa), unknown, putative [Plasmodium sp. gorilla clade G1]|nr:Plasmodium exported protein (PHISTa), unknown, putative [Plasmodium sp. gorilla clade G1]